ncbi:MAG: ABC transporter permease [Candidatus Hermodarchaeota archaeon]
MKTENRKEKQIKLKLRQWFYDLATILRKDLVSTKRVKKYFFGAIIPPIVILIVFSSLSGITDPETFTIMVVDEDDTTYSHIMTDYIGNISSEFAPWFNIINIDTYEEAEAKLLSFENLGLIYIPSGFQLNITANDPNIKGIIYLEVQNINDDYVKNFLQRLDEAVLTFNQEIHVSYGHVDQFAIIAQKDYVIDQNLSMLRGLVIGIISMFSLTCGLFFGSLNVAKEYDDNTIIEILNSPVKRTAYIASKQLIAVTLGLMVVGISSPLLFFLYGVQFRGNLLIVISAFIMSTWIHACIGGLIGLRIKNKMTTILVAIVISVFLWFFMGGFAPVRMLGEQIYFISRFLPGTYWFEIMFSETYYPSLSYSLLRLSVLGILTIAFTIIIWYVISKKGFKL